MIDTIRTHLRADDLGATDVSALKADLIAIAPEQLAAALPTLDGAEQALVYRLLPKATALYVFELLDRDEQGLLIEAMATPDAVEVIEQLDPDDRVHVLDELPARVAKRLVAALEPATAAGIQTMLNYQPGTVGRILSPDYVWVRRTATAGDALELVRCSDLRAEHLSSVFVVDEDRRYRGLVRLADLVRVSPEVSVAVMAEAADVVGRATDDAGEAARALQRRDLDALPVVDSEGRLIGALTVDDAMDAIDQDTSAMMYGIVGIAEPGTSNDVLRSERLTAGSIVYSARVRLTFLIVTLIGGLIVGGVIDAFEDTLASVVALAIFIPLVMDMGGNVGTQSTTIFARGYALGHIDTSRMWRHIAREQRVGLLMASVIGVVGGLAAFAWQGAPNDIPQLGLAVGIALFVSVNLACFLGFFLPYLMTRIGLDHAPGADPFITTIKDFTGLFVYFGLATWVLGIV